MCRYKRGSMELKDVTMNWPGALFACSFGAALTCCLQLMHEYPLFGRFVCCAGIGYLLVDWLGLDAQLQAKQEEVVGLEKQVLVLKSAMHDLSVRYGELEGKYRKACFRINPARSLSTSCL